MRNRRSFLLAVLALFVAFSGTFQQVASAQTADKSKGDDEVAIRALLDEQVKAWNRGDIPNFMASYEDSPETTFVGTATVNKGFQPILERYKKGYANKDQMGILSFKDLDVRLLPSSSGKTEYAVVTGKFHLTRDVKGEATKDDGIFSLVWRKGPGGWKIVLDHTA